MKSLPRLGLVLAAIGLYAASAARADVIYSELQNVLIPTNFTGVYLSLENGVVAENGDWDINPFFGGAGVANSSRFQPARIGSGNEDRIINVGFGGVVSSSLIYSSGFGGSEGHIGSGSNQFQSNTPGYIAFNYTPAGSTFNGWMRVILNPNTSGGVLMDWAYDTTTGNAISAGNIQRALPVDNVSLVTLTGATGESPVLGTNLVDVGGGVVTAVLKNGAGTWTLGNQDYTGTTTVALGTLAVGGNGGKLNGTSGVVVNNGGTLVLAGPTTSHSEPASHADQARSEHGRSAVRDNLNPLVLRSRLLAQATIDEAPDPESRLERNRVRAEQMPSSLDRLLPAGIQSFDRINDAADVVLNGGGRFNTGGLSEGIRPTSASGMDGVVGLGALTLSNTSSALRAIIDFLTGANGSSLVFNSLSSSSAGAYLDILNWTAAAGAGNDRLLFANIGSFKPADLANISFYDDSNMLIATGGTFVQYGNMFELVPVPEPGTWAAGILAVFGAVWSQRQRLQRIAKRRRPEAAA
jgi:autotransporter-associated beta strand protein